MLTFNEMKKMSEGNLSWYFASAGITLEQLLEVADENNLVYSKSESKSRAAIIRTLSKQISGIGVFERIAHDKNLE